MYSNKIYPFTTRRDKGSVPVVQAYNQLEKSKSRVEQRRLVECDTRREHDYSNKHSTTENIERIYTSCLLLSACEGGGEEEEEAAASDNFCRKSGNKVRRGGSLYKSFNKYIYIYIFISNL